jgi:hypothetical protein
LFSFSQYRSSVEFLPIYLKCGRIIQLREGVGRNTEYATKSSAVFIKHIRYCGGDGDGDGDVGVWGEGWLNFVAALCLNGKSTNSTKSSQVSIGAANPRLRDLTVRVARCGLFPFVTAVLLLLLAPCPNFEAECIIA